MLRRPNLICVLLFSQALLLISEARFLQAKSPGELKWVSSYGKAMSTARHERRMLLIHFHGDPLDAHSQQFASLLTTDPEIRSLLTGYVLARLPLSTTIATESGQTNLLDHAAFQELRRRPGVAIIDFTDPDREEYGFVVSVFPFSNSTIPSRQRVKVLLGLPRGSLTQRTLVFAVRMHSEKPKSTNGSLHPVLAEASQDHAAHQARITLQGHHNWSSRANQIQSRLSTMSSVQEVCAESWPGQNLVDAALECVSSWRQSSGHWNAVRSPQTFFGYDMKRGQNGVWYATGIFVR